MSTKRPTEAWRSENLFDLGLGYVTVGRFKATGDAEVGAFLVDVYCLGVKNAMHEKLSASAYEERILKGIFVESERVAMTPACARKLVEDSVAYARNLGLEPHRDYKLGCRVFGGINAAECDTAFTFGQDGKPFYIQGPNDSPQFVQRVMASLTARRGTGNFDFTLVTD